MLTLKLICIIVAVAVIRALIPVGIELTKGALMGIGALLCLALCVRIMLFFL